jgi:hypothetical protein
MLHANVGGGLFFAFFMSVRIGFRKKEGMISPFQASNEEIIFIIII